jgi:hypothetical protein
MQKLDANGNSTTGYLLTQPGQVKTFVIAADANGKTELFVIGLDNQVYAQKFDANGNSASGYFLTAPGAVKSLAVGHDASFHPELFVIGLNNQVYAYTVALFPGFLYRQAASCGFPKEKDSLSWGCDSR